MERKLDVQMGTSSANAVRASRLVRPASQAGYKTAALPPRPERQHLACDPGGAHIRPSLDVSVAALRRASLSFVRRRKSSELAARFDCFSCDGCPACARAFITTSLCCLFGHASQRSSLHVVASSSALAFAKGGAFYWLCQWQISVRSGGSR